MDCLRGWHTACLPFPCTCFLPFPLSESPQAYLHGVFELSSTLNHKCELEAEVNFVPCKENFLLFITLLAWSFNPHRCQPNACDFFRHISQRFYEQLSSLLFCSRSNPCLPGNQTLQTSSYLCEQSPSKRWHSSPVQRKKCLCLCRVLSGAYQPQTRKNHLLLCQ